MALIPPYFLDCVVAVGTRGRDGKVYYGATGFLCGKLIEERENGDKRYYVFLVTNRHVVGNEKVLYLRFNPEVDEPARELEAPLLDEKGRDVCFGHNDPKIDLVVVPVNTEVLQGDHIRYAYFRSDHHILMREDVKRIGMSEGDGVFVLGFPMGLIGGSRNFVIVRQGVIARIRDYLSGSGKEILIDATIFPGNSGGPVVTRPEMTAIERTQPQKRAYLLGVISSYLPYEHKAISEQTNRVMVTFQENSGLASVVPAHYIIETMERATSLLNERQQEQPVDIEAAPSEQG